MFNVQGEKQEMYVCVIIVVCCKMNACASGHRVIGGGSGEGGSVHLVAYIRARGERGGQGSCTAVEACT